MPWNSPAWVPRKLRRTATRSSAATTSSTRLVGVRPPSGARRRWLHLGARLAAAAWDEQDGQRRDDRPCGADEEGDLEAGVLGEPAGEDVRCDEAAGDLRADCGADVAHDRVDAGGLAGLPIRDGGDDEVGDRGEGCAGAEADEAAPEDDQA